MKAMQTVEDYNLQVYEILLPQLNTSAIMTVFKFVPFGPQKDPIECTPDEEGLSYTLSTAGSKTNS